MSPRYEPALLKSLRVKPNQIYDHCLAKGFLIPKDN